MRIRCWAVCVSGGRPGRNQVRRPQIMSCLVSRLGSKNGKILQKEMAFSIESPVTQCRILPTSCWYRQCCVQQFCRLCMTNRDIGEWAGPTDYYGLDVSGPSSSCERIRTPVLPVHCLQSLNPCIPATYATSTGL